MNVTIKVQDDKAQVFIDEKLVGTGKEYAPYTIINILAEALNWDFNVEKLPNTYKGCQACAGGGIAFDINGGTAKESKACRICGGSGKIYVNQA